MSTVLHAIGNQKILTLTKDEELFLEGCRAQFFELLEDTGIELDDDSDFVAACDEVIRMWHQSSPDTRPVANEIVNTCGVILGDHLCLEFELEWAICEDASGADLCIFRKKNDLVFFPAHSVAKRISSGPAGFMTDLYEGLRNTISELK